MADRRRKPDLLRERDDAVLEVPVQGAQGSYVEDGDRGRWVGETAGEQGQKNRLGLSRPGRREQEGVRLRREERERQALDLRGLDEPSLADRLLEARVERREHGGRSGHNRTVRARRNGKG